MTGTVSPDPAFPYLTLWAWEADDWEGKAGHHWTSLGFDRKPMVVDTLEAAQAIAGAYFRAHPECPAINVQSYPTDPAEWDTLPDDELPEGPNGAVCHEPWQLLRDGTVLDSNAEWPHE